jgi:plastocyanin
MRVVLIAVLLAAAWATLAHAGTPANVSIENFTFDPPSLSVPAGSEVTWTNHDDIPHLVQDDGGSFTSPPLDTDDSFTRRFDRPGTYAYFCTLHPHMQGTIVVTAGSGA